MVGDVPVDVAELFGVIFGALIYGLSFVLALSAISVLRKLERAFTSRVFLLTAYLLPSLATLHLAVNLYRIHYAFLVLETRAERLDFLGRVPNWSYILRDGLFCSETVIADSVLAYRCYRVWGRKLWAGILPMILCIGTIVSCIGTICVASSQSGGIFEHDIGAFITSFWAFTLATNVIATGLIVVPLARSERRMIRYATSGNLGPVITVVVESGGIYCCTCIVTFAFFASHSNLQTLILNAIPSIIVFVFSMVLSRIGLRIKHKATHISHNSPQPGITRDSGHIFSSAPGNSPLEIRMTKLVEDDTQRGKYGSGSDDTELETPV